MTRIAFQRRRVSLLIGLLALFTPVVPVRAMKAGVVTLEAAYRSALSRNEGVAIAREALIQSEETAKGARSYLYPTISADLDYLRRPKALRKSGFLLRSESETRFNFTVAQSLYSGGRATAAYRSEKLGIRGRRLDLSLEEENLLFAVARAYYNALKAANNVTIEQKEVERLAAHRKNAQKRLQVGDVAKTVLLRAEAELSDARAKLIRAKNDEVAAKDRLALLAKLPRRFRLAEPPGMTLAERSEADWIDTALKHRKELRRKGVAVDQAAEGIARARGNFLPLLSLEFQYSWVDQEPTGSFLIQNDTTASLKLTVPIFEGMLRTAELARARSRLRETVLVKRRTVDEITLAVRQALLDLSTLTGELQHLEDRVRFAQEAFTLASRQFAVGLGTHIDVLDASAGLLDAERRLSNTRYDRTVALLALQKAAGVFNPFPEME